MICEKYVIKAENGSSNPFLLFSFFLPTFLFYVNKRVSISLLIVFWGIDKVIYEAFWYYYFGGEGLLTKEKKPEMMLNLPKANH